MRDAVVYSPLAFGALALWASAAGEHVMAWTLNALMATSLLHHATHAPAAAFAGRRVVARVDRALAHWAVAYEASLALRAGLPPAARLLIAASCAYVVAAFYGAVRPRAADDSWRPWQASLHLAACGGAAAFLACRAPRE